MTVTRARSNECGTANSRAPSCAVSTAGGSTRGEDGDQRADLAAVGGQAQVLDALGGHGGGVAESAQVADLEPAPRHAAGAPAAVAQGDPRAVGRLLTIE
ncbi:hypothetical protein GCM10009634_08770 [Saccharothrix xinjiangensis]